MSFTQIEVTPQWANYLDLDNDVKPYLQIPAASTASDVLLQGILEMSCTWVQNYLGRAVAPTQFFRRFSGWVGIQGAYIMLPYYPVLQMISVIEYWGQSGAHTLTEQTPANQGGSDMYTMDYLRGVVIRSFRGLVARPWFPGLRNVEITWIAGYNPVPADIRFATLQLIAHWWRQTQQASRTFPAPAGALQPEEPVQGMFGGVPPETERLLVPYVQQGLG